MQYNECKRGGTSFSSMKVRSSYVRWYHTGKGGLSQACPVWSTLETVGSVVKAVEAKMSRMWWHEVAERL